jgi:transcription termination/antitermination protein NusG
MTSGIYTPAWYVLYTKSRFENIVHEGLSKKSIEAFLPKIKVASKRRDRKIILDVPLFPGYLFVKTGIDATHYLDVVKTAGVAHFIGNKDGPIPVREETVASIRIMVSAGGPILTGTTLKKGDRVMVVRGPMTGVTGVFVRYRGKSRIVVHVEALGQFAGVDIDAADVETLPEIFS